jgi:hypothetical protein
MTEVVQRQFQLNRRDEFIKSFVQEAITRVIQPLQLDVKATNELDPELEPIPLEELRMPEPMQIPVERREETLDDWK